MIVCGVDLKGSDAIVVVLDGNKDNFKIVDTGVSKIVLGDTTSPEDVRTFTTTFHSFIKNHNITNIAIKKRNTKGQFAGGANSFKMEGLIQLTPKANISLLSAVSISSILKKNPPPEAQGILVYQKGAYEIAYALLRSL